MTVKVSCKICRRRIQERRAALGYATCVQCGSARGVFTVAPAYNKGAYQVIGLNSIKDIGR